MNNIQITEEVSQVKQKRVVSTYVDGDIYEKLKRESEDEFMSIADLVRKFIYKYYRDKELKEKESERK